MLTEEGRGGEGRGGEMVLHDDISWLSTPQKCMFRYMKGSLLKRKHSIAISMRPETKQSMYM